jgi:GTP cyclohydrolase II
MNWGINIMDQIQVTRMVSTRIPTDAGEFQLILYKDDREGKEHLALVMGDVRNESGVLVRVHSECFTGDVLGSRRCDCGEQLQRAIEKISKVGQGVLIYLRQEGRGIGLLDKLRAYNLQDEGYDTVDANLLLGHQADERDYTVAACILRDLGIQSVRLLTNNPGKIKHLRELEIRVEQRVPLEPTVTEDNARYLRTKALRMNHIFNLGRLSVNTPVSGNGSH